MCTGKEESRTWPIQVDGVIVSESLMGEGAGREGDEFHAGKGRDAKYRC